MQQSNQNMENKNNDLTEIITQVLNEMKMELGDSFDIDKVNLAELERRTGITQAKLRRIKSNGFVDKPHGLTDRKAEYTVLSGYTAVIDNLLGKSITNASLIHERIRELGYSGGLTSIKDYIAQHRYLIPAKLFFASTFWTKLQNIFGHYCKSKLDKVAKPRLAAILPAA